MDASAPNLDFNAARPLRSSVPDGPQSLQDMFTCADGSAVLQIVPPMHVYRPAYVPADSGNHELLSQPLASPTGPGGAPGFSNRGGSQLAVPQVVNVYLGPYWGDKALLESFSKAVVEYGYLQPLAELNYGTGPGNYLGPVEGDALVSGTTLADADAQGIVVAMLDAGRLSATADSLFILILPTGVTSTLNTAASCTTYCGYHSSFQYHGKDVTYAVLPSPVGCSGCGNGAVGSFTAVYAHELAEAATDKVPGRGWVANNGEENGDLEAWVLFGWGPPGDPKRFTVQGYYTNERGNTVGAWSGPDV